MDEFLSFGDECCLYQGYDNEIPMDIPIDDSALSEEWGSDF